MNAAPVAGQDTRSAILQVVEQARAIHKSALCRQVDRAWGTVGYHLRLLKQEGLLVTERHGGLLWAFPASLQRWERKEARILAEPGADSIIVALARKPGLTVDDLDAELDLPTKTIRRHLSQLQEVSLIDKEGKRPQRFSLVAMAKRATRRDESK